MKNKVKGFTLIELIVVMAIFSIIMFGAMSLMTPSNKIMLNAENTESGAAAVNSIAKFLETELSTAEYVHIYGTLDSEADIAQKAAEFNAIFYRGVLQANSPIDPASSRKYGSGEVHVLQINNLDGGKITKWDFATVFDCDPNDLYDSATNNMGKIYPVTQIGDKIEYAVNKAYYNSYYYDIIPGRFSNVEEFVQKQTEYNDQTTYTGAGMEMLNYMSSKEVSFSIMATQKKVCSKCGKTIKLINGSNVCPLCGEMLSYTGRSFVDVASVPLINIYERGLGGNAAVSGHYFVVLDSVDPLDPTKTVSTVYDRATKAMTGYVNILDGMKFVHGSDANGFTIYYSYAAEQDTSKP